MLVVFSHVAAVGLHWVQGYLRWGFPEYAVYVRTAHHERQRGSANQPEEPSVGFFGHAHRFDVLSADMLSSLIWPNF